MITLNNIQAIVTDIEGTTTPITFVHETLFPFAKSNLRHHLTVNFESDETRNDIALLAEQAAEDIERSVTTTAINTPPKIDIHAAKDTLIDQVVRNVEHNMMLDRKMAALKQLQGHIWKFGYESGNVVGEVYSDVVPMFARWKEAGKSLYVYSSGSVFAQKLLFGYSNQKYNESNDLTPLFGGYFDTVHPGSKLEAKSYKVIASDIQVAPEHILFLTDNIQEAFAAKDAGWHVVLSVRPSTAALPPQHPFETVTSFDQIQLE